MGALPEYLQQSWPTERQLTRFRLSVPVRIAVSIGMETQATSFDVSEGGLGTSAADLLKVGDEVFLELQLPGHDQLLRFKAIARHSDAERLGFEFLTITPEQRLAIINYGHSLASIKKRPKLLR